MKKNLIFLIICVLIMGFAVSADVYAEEGEQIVLGNRIPMEYFITWGQGESDVSIHTGSYDDALKMANIENCNIMTYSSVMPPEAKEIPVPEKLHHGCVLETIMADMSGKEGERLTAGLITWNIKQKSDGTLLGGFVAEYHGHGTEEVAKENLTEAMEGMNARRGYSGNEYEVCDVQLIVKSFIPEKEYGTIMVVIGFTSYIFPVIDK